MLTRNDYLGAPPTSAALFGLVQAMLLTRHMLFVGYSLADEDFHQIVHQVNAARRRAKGHSGSVLGTALVLHADQLQSTLWDGTVDIRSIGSDDCSTDVPTEARRLQIFLDLLGHLSADLSGFLMDPTYDDLLDDDEKELAERLRDLRDVAAGTEGAVRVEAFLRSIGLSYQGDS